MAGLEQPLTRRFSIVADWMSGNHELSAVIPAVQAHVGHNVLITGLKIPTASEGGETALILEVMVSLSHFRSKKNPADDAHQPEES
jgi:hypothetical protein